MAQLCADTVRSLASFKGVHGPVVSLYLDVDGQRYIRVRDYEAQLEHLLRRARERMAGPAGDTAGVGGRDADPDLRRIEQRVKAGVDRSRVRSLAMFSCAADGYFERVDLAVPVRNQLAISPTPHVRQLESLLERHPRFGVLLVDRQRARMFVHQAGELTDHSELFDQLPRHDDDRGDWDRDHVRDHSAAVAQRHARRAAAVAFDLHQRRPFDHLILAGPDTALHEVERELHSYLRERIVARLRLAATAAQAEIRHAAIQAESVVEQRRTDGLVRRLRDAIGTNGASLLGLARPGALAAPPGSGGGSGVAGLDPVLQALVEHRVDTLLVSDGFEAPGWRCRVCNLLASRGPACRQCSASVAASNQWSAMLAEPGPTTKERATMEPVDDVVEEAIEMALNQSARVVTCDGNADLDVLGRIGALLRY